MPVVFATDLGLGRRGWPTGALGWSKIGWFSGPQAPSSTLVSPVTSRSNSVRLVSRCLGVGSTCLAGAVGLAEAQDWQGAGGRCSPGSTPGGSSLAGWNKHRRRWFVALPVARTVPLPSARLPLCDLG
jgi:hypothetical protein